MIHRLFAVGQILLVFSIFTPLAHAGAADLQFSQEIHQPHPLQGRAPNDVRAVAVDRSGTAWVATQAGLFRKTSANPSWEHLKLSEPEGPALEVAVDDAGTAWFGLWNGLYRASPNGTISKLKGIDHLVTVIMPDSKDGAFAFGPQGAWHVTPEGKVREQPLEILRGTRAAALSGSDLWIVSNLELHRGRVTTDSSLELLETTHIKGDATNPAMSALALDSEERIWTGGMGGLGVFHGGTRGKILTPADGLPNSDVRALAFAPDRRLWIGTALGVARYDGKDWTLRHGRRWLLNDDIRDMAFAPDGSAWIATAGGVSVIRAVDATLEQKAAQYLKACHTRHIREPGLVEKCNLPTPGDTSKWEPRDDDNDGQYTCMYLAMESYRYAATKDPKARERARNAFRALKFLQTVTETEGFVARTVIPATWTQMADPNEEISDPEWADELAHEPRAKRVEQRWRPSADGKWLWKGDTSSDEITGHFYAYLMYHDLAADAGDKREVAGHVSRIMDDIIEGGYTLRDLDGAHTRWGVWSPEKLNHDPLWSPERGINSVEILSYLKTSYHITGDERYKMEYFRLAREEGYAENTRMAKTINPAVRTHIDDELLALAWPGLFLPMGDDDLITTYRVGLEVWRNETKIEKSPFFNFVYAALAEKPDPTLEDSLFFLRDAPLDLIRWTVDNSRREDLHLSRLPEYEHVQTSRLPPPSERGVIRWDDNPWIAVQGDGGRTESDGVYWLLPYWMGRYYGYIDPAKPVAPPSKPD